MDFLTATWHLYLRLLRATLRMPVFLVLAIVQPILWVVLFGQLFGKVTSLPGFGEQSYIQFLAPGIAVMTALFGAAHSGMGLLIDMERGVLDRLLATPVRRGAIIASRLVHAASQVSAQAVIILGVSAVLGARPHGGAAGIAALLLAAALLGGAVAAFSNGLALVMRRQESVIAATNFVLLPAIYLSSMMMAPALMPAWIRGAARYNPVNWAVVAARNGFEGRDGGKILLALALLAAFTLLCAGFATAAFRRYQRSL